MNTNYDVKTFTRLRNLLLVACCLAASGPACADETSVAVPADGSPFPATVTEIDSDWNVTLQVDSSQQTMDLDGLIRWGAYRDKSRGSHVVFTDGSLIAAELLEIDQETLTIEADLCGRLEFPIRQLKVPINRVRGVIFDPPADAFERDRLLQRIITAQGVADRVLLKNADVFEGAVQGIGESVDSANSIEVSLQLVVDGHPLEISLEKALAVVFNPALAEKTPERGRHVLLGFDDGSLLNVNQVEASGGFMRLDLRCSVQLDVDPAMFRDELTYLCPLGGRVRYVSDLQPLSSKQIPWLQTQWPLQRDRSVTGGRLRCAGQVHTKGLGMHSAASVAYKLESSDLRFDAELAVDQQAGVQGSVVFRVFLYDAAGKRGLAYETPIVRGGDAPLPISIDVSGSRAMALVVDFSDRGHVLDHANWLNARLIRAP